MTREQFVMKNQVDKADYLPTPLEIARRCEEIQRGWSVRERERRLLFVVTESECAPSSDDEISGLGHHTRMANAI